MNQFNKLDKIFIFLAIISGSLILLFPVQNLLLVFSGLIFFIFLLLKPKYCFYLMLALSTYVFPFETATRQLPFNQTDILIALCFVSILSRIILSDQHINLKTRLDKWIIFLLIVYFLAGITSISHRGYQGFLKFGETIAVFYLTVYFVRSKEITISNLVKFMLFVGIFQALYGVLQSSTGSFGANFHSNRGYLGYLGLGSTLVWHARGTFIHFNHFGPFLSTLFLFFLPIKHFIVKNKIKGNIILLILLFGVIVSYSRGSLMGLILGFVFFLYQTKKSKIKFFSIAIPLLLIIFCMANFLKETSYVSTISARDDIWALVFAAITSSTKNLLFGTGLKSYTDAVWVYMPGNILPSAFNDFQAHNFILYYVVEMGIIGATIIILFLINNLVIAYNNVKNGNKLTKALSSSVSIIIVSFFLEGMFDTAFNNFVTQIWLYLILGIIYAKITMTSKNKIKENPG